MPRAFSIHTSRRHIHFFVGIHPTRTRAGDAPTPSNMFLKDAAKKLAQESAARTAADADRAREHRRHQRAVETNRIEREKERQRERAEERRKKLAEADAANARRGANGAEYAGRLRVERSEAAKTRGIRARWEDKAQLPRSCARAVGADACGRAHFYVERVTDGGASSVGTHVGVLDYGSVEEGKIGLPGGVVAALGDARDGEEVSVRYAALPTGSKMTLKPKTNDFAKDFANDDVREVLERVMMGRSCVTVGDKVFVERDEANDGDAGGGSGRKRYELLVTAVRPDDEETRAISLLETDVEVELEPSEEYERVVAELETRQRRRKEEFERAKEALAEREREKLAEKEAFEERKRALKASIKPEPDEPRGTAGIVTLRFSLPNGTLATRRFRSGDAVRDVFDFARSLDDDVLARDAGEVILAARQVPGGSAVEIKESDAMQGAVIDETLDARTFFIR